MARTRSSTSGLTHLLADSAAPVYAVDEERRILFCNAACAAWLAVEPDEFVGTRCDYHSADQPETLARLAAGLCPPPTALAGDRVSAMVARESSAGELLRRHADFLPLRDAAGNVIGVLAFVAPEDLPADVAATSDAATGDADMRSEDLHERIRLIRTSLRRRFQVDRLLGDSVALRRVREQVRVAIEARARVLVVGPPGSGREHVARTIHAGWCQVAERTLLPLACPLLDADLLKSALDAVGRVSRSASGGRAITLLLQEVDQLTGELQTELIRFLASARGVDVPLVATARQPLLSLPGESFRADLAGAISTLVIELPPLAARPQDVPLLAQAFVEESNAAGQRQWGGFTPDALTQLAAYPWPGNVDELSQVVDEACTRASGPLITAADLPPQVHHAAQVAARPPRGEAPIVLDDFLTEIERELIARALQRAKGNKAKAARMLGVTRTRLHRRIEQLGREANP